MSDPAAFTLYAVRNAEGRYFRAKGYGGHGDSWVDGMAKARLYVKLGPVRSIVTFFATKHPSFGRPVIVSFTATESGVIDESERVEKTMQRKREADQRVRARRGAQTRPTRV